MTNIVDFEGRGEFFRVGKPEPFGHRLAVEIDGQRLVPVPILRLANELIVDVPANFFGSPEEPVTMEIVGEPEGRFPRFSFGDVFLSRLRRTVISDLLTIVTEPFCVPDYIIAFNSEEEKKSKLK